MASTQCGTPAYMAPETLEDVPVYNHQADLWSLGCVIFEMCCLKPAFSGGRRSIIEKIFRAEYGPAPETAIQVHARLLALVASLLIIQSDLRISADTILSRYKQTVTFDF